MKVLMISTDSKILDDSSEVRARMQIFRQSFTDLRILLVAKSFSFKIKKTQILDNPELLVYKMSWWRSFFWQPDFSVDVITAQDPFENGLVGFRLAQRLQKPLQLQIHTDFLSDNYKQESRKNELRILMAKWLLPKATNVRVVSQRIKKSLVTKWNFDPTKITVLQVWWAHLAFENHNYPSVHEKWRENYPQFKKIILVVSRLTKEKNITLVVKALAGLSKSFSNTGLVIIGEGPEKTKLQGLVKKLNLESMVVFLPWINSASDLVHYYRQADVFVNTSWYEGFGRTIVEALASGCPVISTEVGVAKEAGALITGNNSKELTEAIEKILSDPKPKIFLPDNFKMSLPDYIQKFKEGLELGLNKIV